MNKKFLKLTLVGLCAVSLITGCGCSNDKKKEEKKQEEEVVRTNTNEDVIKNQEVEQFKFENTSLAYIDGTSYLETTVTNTSSEDQSLVEFWIHVYNEKGEEVVRLTGFVGSTLKAGESKSITSSYGDDLSKATKIEYEVVRELNNE